MAIYLLRVQLPDRPGALGAVASRIGAVRADVVALDIVGCGEGRAVDEFVVELADDSHVSLLLSEVAEVDGVEVEELRVLPSELADRRFDAYDTAAALLSERSHRGVLSALVVRASRELQAGWAAILDTEERQLVTAEGRPPAAPWLTAYVEGTRWHGNRARSADPRRPDAPEQAPITSRVPDGLDVVSDGPDNPSIPVPPDSSTGPLRSNSLERRRRRTPARPAPPAPLPGIPVRPLLAELAWADLRQWGLVLAVGRPGWPLGEGDKTRLEAIARLGDLRWADLATHAERAGHPSRAG